ncbi:MAG TPA: transposase [Candidatus Nitrosocosmicus sp.]
MSLERYESTSKKRLELVCFYQAVLGQTIYSRRRISIEPLIEHIKSVFRIDPLHARGYHTVSATVLISFIISANGIL